MNRKGIAVLLTMAIVFLGGCISGTPPKTAEEAAASGPAVEYSGTTSRGTPVVNQSKSAFAIADVELISTPDSTCFSQIGYDENYAILVVIFRDSGSAYLYEDFPKSEWIRFCRADSLGSYYQSHIKGQYEGGKWE